MKNKKLGFISLISVLSIGGVAFAAVASTQNSYLSEVEAEETSPCTVRLLSTNAPTLQNGSGTGLSGTVEFKYSNASVEANSHVKLGYLGSVQTSGLAWDGTKGGVINGIRSISVEFEKDKVMYDDPYGWSKIPASSLKLISIYQDGATSQDSLDKSGKTMTFKETNLPTGFKIELQKDYDYEGDTSGLFAKIKSVTIQADMIVRNRINLTEHGHRCKLWYSNANHENLGSISNLSYNNFIAGSVIGFTLDPEYGETMKLDGITYSGGSLVEEVVEGQLCPNYYFTLAEGQVGEIEIVTAGRPELYPGKAFLGKYTAGTLLNWSIKEKPVEIKSDGSLLWDTNKWSYTLDAQDNITINEQPNNATRQLEVINENLVRLIETNKTGNTTPVYTYAYRGTTDEVVTTMITKKCSSSLNASDYIVNFKNGENETTILTYYQTSVIDGVNGVTITPLDNEVATLATKFKVEETLAKGSSFELDKKFPSAKHVVTGETETATIYVGFNNNESGIKTITSDGYEGTYTGASGNLVINGFGRATLGNAPATTYTIANDVVTLASGELFTLDTVGNTYTVETLIKDPWANAARRYAYKNSTSYYLEFHNGEVTVALDGFDSVKVPYELVDDKVKFSAKYYFQDQLGGEANGTAKFEFTIGANADNLTSAKSISVDLYFGFEPNPTSTVSIVSINDVYVGQ